MTACNPDTTGMATVWERLLVLGAAQRQLTLCLAPALSVLFASWYIQLAVHAARSSAKAWEQHEMGLLVQRDCRADQAPAWMWSSKHMNSTDGEGLCAMPWGPGGVLTSRAGN